MGQHLAQSSTLATPANKYRLRSGMSNHGRMHQGIDQGASTGTPIGASKAGTVGSGLLLLAVGLHAADIATFGRAVAGIVFFILTAPISAHLLARAAHKVGYKLSSASVRDDMMS